MKICVITGTRAEYGLFYWLLKEIENDPKHQLQLVATGMHLSPEFGLTYKEIEKEFTISKKIISLLSSDEDAAITKSMGITMMSFAEYFDEQKPDLVIVLGDRFEIFSAVSAAMIAKIPIAHLHGGENTEGLIDEPIRHSITKMSHLHFTATEKYRQRVIQLGEQPKKVFNVGGLGIDNIKKLELLSKKDFEESINFKLNKKNILITYHPVTLENNTSEKDFKEILNALDELENTNLIFTKANADTNGRIINKLIDDYVSDNKEKSVCFSSLGQLRYLSALKYVDIVLGNSSSGLAEVPSFKITTINIGDRQKGRIKADSVIDCKPEENDVLNAIKLSYSTEFQEKLKTVDNPYGNGGASKKIMGIINDTNFKNIIKKPFFDITFNAL